jgi:hypothetical protein
MVSLGGRRSQRVRRAGVGDVYLIESVRRDAAGAITHVGWCRKKPYTVCFKAEVAEVIAALRGGVKVNVAIGFIIGHGVQVSADGTTIVNQGGGLPQAFRLEDVPLL